MAYAQPNGVPAVLALQPPIPDGNEAQAPFLVTFTSGFQPGVDGDVKWEVRAWAMLRQPSSQEHALLSVCRYSLSAEDSLHDYIPRCTQRCARNLCPASTQIYRHKTYSRSHVIVARTQWVDFVGYTHGADRSRLEPSCMCVFPKPLHPEIMSMFMQDRTMLAQCIDCSQYKCARRYAVGQISDGSKMSYQQVAEQHVIRLEPQVVSTPTTATIHCSWAGSC